MRSLSLRSLPIAITIEFYEVAGNAVIRCGGDVLNHVAAKRDSPGLAELPSVYSSRYRSPPGLRVSDSALGPVGTIASAHTRRQLDCCARQSTLSCHRRTPRSEIGKSPTLPCRQALVSDGPTPGRTVRDSYINRLRGRKAMKLPDHHSPSPSD